MPFLLTHVVCRVAFHADAPVAAIAPCTSFTRTATVPTTANTKTTTDTASHLLSLNNTETTITTARRKRGK